MVDARAIRLPKPQPTTCGPRDSSDSHNMTSELRVAAPTASTSTLMPCPEPTTHTKETRSGPRSLMRIASCRASCTPRSKAMIGPCCERHRKIHLTNALRRHSQRLYMRYADASRQPFGCTTIGHVQTTDLKRDGAATHAAARHEQSPYFEITNKWQ